MSFFPAVSWRRSLLAMATVALIAGCSDDSEEKSEADVPTTPTEIDTVDPEVYRQANDAFAESYRTREGVTALDSGVALTFKKRGEEDARQVGVQDFVTIYYRGTLTDGSEFDARQRPDAPVTFDLAGLIRGWQEALPQMREGDIAEIMVPASLGYGTRGTPNIPAHSTLLFEIEVVKTRTGEETVAEFTKAQQDYLAENAKADGVTVTASGLQYKVLELGDGEKPGPDAIVKAHYEGKLIDNSVFDSSFERGEPADFPLEGVIPGWTEGLQYMPVGSTFEFTIPANLGYGERGSPPRIPGGATLIFKVQLISFESRKEEFAARQRVIDESKAFVEAAQKEADEVTASGVAIKFIDKKDGKLAGPDDIVKVHYRGVLADGTVFDETRTRDLPQNFQLTNIIPGWKESLQRIPEGSTVEIVIPQELAYGKQGATGIPPYSALKFEIELLQVSTPEEENARLEVYREQQVAWLAANKAKDGIVTLETGIQYKVIKQGEGEGASGSNRIKFHYKGALTNGRVFVDSADREPDVQPLGALGPGLRDVLTLMPVGSVYEIYLPAEMAFGAQGRGSLIPPHSTIIYTFEIIEIFE